MGMLRESEKRDIKTILAFFFGNEASHYKINGSVAKVVFKMINEVERCSLAFNMVPHPPAGPADMAYLLMEIGRAASAIKRGDDIKNLR